MFSTVLPDHFRHRLPWLSCTQQHPEINVKVKISEISEINCRAQVSAATHLFLIHFHPTASLLPASLIMINIREPVYFTCKYISALMKSSWQLKAMNMWRITSLKPTDLPVCQYDVIRFTSVPSKISSKRSPGAMWQFISFSHLTLSPSYDTCKTELPKVVSMDSRTHTHTHIYIYIYIYICECACVCLL